MLYSFVTDAEKSLWLPVARPAGHIPPVLRFHDTRQRCRMHNWLLFVRSSFNALANQKNFSQFFRRKLKKGTCIIMHRP